MNRGVFIAMPVYQGAEVIEETIRSILAQTFTDFHLVMSVDGADDPTVEVCRKYADDPRIDVVVQEHRLGWPGNFNWLVENCDREFFCYWQQDDLASTGYLENLRRELLARPDAAIAYTDVQWFGATFDRTSTPSIEGDPLSRVMQHVEAIRYEPLRGLMRTSMIPSGSDPIPVTEDESCQEEFVFLTHLAGAGAFVRIDSAMYFKRLHDANAFMRWTHFPDWRRRRGWISMGAGMYRIAIGLAAPAERPVITAQIADRLAVIRHGRGHFYAPPQTSSEITRFVRDFVAYAGLEPEDLGPSGIRPDGLQRPVNEDVLRALEAERIRARTRSDLGAELQDAGRLSLDATAPTGEALLGYGWSKVEDWGVWTDGGEARVHVPAPPGSSWTMTIEGPAFGDSEVARVRYCAGTGPVLETTVPTGTPGAVVVGSDGRATTIRLLLPDAVAPEMIGISADPRVLGFGLQHIDIELVDPPS
jgi:glycosyltransferase involved in cell wall biosynthesis